MPLNPTLKSILKPVPLILALAVALSALILAWHRTPKLAYIESSRVIDNFILTEQMQKELQGEKARLDQDLKSLAMTVDSVGKLLKSGKVPKDKAKALQDEYLQRLRDFGQYKEMTENQYKAKEQDGLNKLLAKINVAVSQYAKENGYRFIFGTSNGNIVYADRVADVTDDIVKLLNETYRYKDSVEPAAQQAPVSQNAAVEATEESAGSGEVNPEQLEAMYGGTVKAEPRKHKVDNTVRKFKGGTEYDINQSGVELVPEKKDKSGK